MMDDQILLETSQEMGEFFGALAKAQSEIEPARKDLVNIHLKSGNEPYRYSSLSACLEAAKPLAANGISIIQIPVGGSGTLSLVTILGHSSGQWLKGTLKVPEFGQSDKQRKAVNTLQTMGVRLTYAKRYMLTSMTGIASDEDTDGEVGGADHGNGEKDAGKRPPQTSNQNGNSKPIPPRPWGPQMTKEVIWTKVGLYGEPAEAIDKLESVNEQMVELLRKQLTDLFANDEKIAPDDVNKIVPDFLDGCFGVKALSELKAPFGPGILKYLSKKEDRKVCQEEILAFMKNE